MNLILSAILNELGVNVLTELDFAIFEANHEIDFISEVDPRVAEALQGAGLAHVVHNALRFSPSGPFWHFKNALADAISSTVGPQADLPDVCQGLWQIERTIRKVLREAAIALADGKWRKNMFNETIASRVLERARNDVSVTAASISDLRDPTEWLSLGELLEVVRSSKFEGLSWGPIEWDRFAQDVLPIRNRLSHMRLLKKGDRVTVYMWTNRITRLKSG